MRGGWNIEKDEPGVFMRLNLIGGFPLLRISYTGDRSLDEVTPERENTRSSLFLKLQADVLPTGHESTNLLHGVSSRLPVFPLAPSPSRPFNSRVPLHCLELNS